MMGIIKALKCCQNLYQGLYAHVLGLFFSSQTMTLGWPRPFLWQGQICFLMLLYGWQLIQHWVLLYFQVCSNSAYPQHSVERYRSMVHCFFLFLRTCRCRVTALFLLSYCKLLELNTCISSRTAWARLKIFGSQIVSIVIYVDDLINFWQNSVNIWMNYLPFLTLSFYVVKWHCEQNIWRTA